jgi:hypothetical protein
VVNRMQPTPHQQQAIDAIRGFVAGPRDCFILKGSAGTGKTTLLAVLTQWLRSKNLSYQMLAPTGRAARILGSKTHSDASTIHSIIYALERMEVFEQAEAPNDPGVRLWFGLRTEDPGNILFIVDEASMVGDVENEQDALRFGSGRLLTDLIEYSRIARAGRKSADPGAKLLFVGDPAQLPPVGQSFSPALSAHYLSETFSVKCEEFALTEVQRQRSGSAILERATALRDAIAKKKFDSFDLSPSLGVILASGISESIARVTEVYRRGGGSSVLITHSNQVALELNQTVRGRLWGDERAVLRKGDQLVINQNNRRYGLFNGDLVRVMDVDPSPQIRQVGMRGASPVCLSFRNSTIAYRQANQDVCRVDCLLLENLLESKERGLSPLEQRALLVDFRQRYPHLRPRTQEFKLAITKDPWFNALQVKYGYALTCHKAQGGEWSTVVVNFENNGGRNEGFFRWAYTAITRAKSTLMTIGAPKFDAYSDIQWGDPPASPECDNPSQVPTQVDPRDNDWARFSFTAGDEPLFEYHMGLREAWRNLGIDIERLDHLQYCERYFLVRDGHRAAVQYWYKGNRKFSRADKGPGLSDPALAEQALAAMRDRLAEVSEVPTEPLTDFEQALIERIEQAVADTDVRVIGYRRMQYCLRVDFNDGGNPKALDFRYNKKRAWTYVEEVGKKGAAGGLLERLRMLV